MLRDGGDLYGDAGRWQAALAAVAAAVRHGRPAGFQLELLRLEKGADAAGPFSLQGLEEDFAAAGEPLVQLTRSVSVTHAWLDGSLASCLTDAGRVLASEEEELDGLAQLQQYGRLEALALWASPELPSPDLGCLAALPRLRSLALEVPAEAAPLDVARQLPLPHLSCLRLSGVALEGRAFAKLLHLTSLRELSGGLPARLRMACILRLHECKAALPGPACWLSDGIFDEGLFSRRSMPKCSWPPASFTSSAPRASPQ